MFCLNNKGMISFPNCKINLGLRVTEKRPDGFHNIESCFYPVQWQEVVEIIEHKELKFTASGIPVPDDEKGNLCVQVWKALNKRYQIPKVHIHLHKTIPIGAGLGGGSSDAAFTLKLLNEKFQLKLSDDSMEEIIKPLGSDCAFFIRNKPVIAINKGDEFISTGLSLKGKWILLVYPGIHISTKEAYSGIKPKKSIASLSHILEKDIEDWKFHLQNDFEEHLFVSYPVLETIKNSFYKSGAVYASMTGSGSCLYGIFNTEPDIEPFYNQDYIIKKTLLE